MPALIDEVTAWSLVRSIPPEPWGSASVRLEHDFRPEVWLQVEDSGQWESSTATDAARTLLDVFVPLAVPANLVIAQIGQSLDGRIATHTGHSHYITGPDDIRRLHRLRALVDAVVVGAGTVATDDPHLTVRHVEGRSPVRVVLDPRGRLDRRRHVFTDGAARTILVTLSPAGAGLSVEGDVIRMPGNADARLPPRAILDALRALGFRRILIEGGGATVSGFVQADAVDRLHVTVAPMVIGSGRPGLALERIDSLDHALRPACRIFRLGEDVLFDLDFRQRTDPS